MDIMHHPSQHVAASQRFFGYHWPYSYNGWLMFRHFSFYLFKYPLQITGTNGAAWAKCTTRTKCIRGSQTWNKREQLNLPQLPASQKVADNRVKLCQLIVRCCGKILVLQYDLVETWLYPLPVYIQMSEQTQMYVFHHMAANCSVIIKHFKKPSSVSFELYFCFWLSIFLAFFFFSCNILFPLHISQGSISC